MSAPFKVKNAADFEVWAHGLNIASTRCPRAIGSNFYTIAPMRGADWSTMRFPPDVADTEGVGVGHWFAHELGKHIASGVVVIYETLGASMTGTATWADVTITLIAPDGSFSVHGAADLAAMALSSSGWSLGHVDIYEPGTIGCWATEVRLPDPLVSRCLAFRIGDISDAGRGMPLERITIAHLSLADKAAALKAENVVLIHGARHYVLKSRWSAAQHMIKASYLGSNPFAIIDGCLVIEVTGDEVGLEGHPAGKLICHPWTQADSDAVHPEYDVLGATVSRYPTNDTRVVFHDLGVFVPNPAADAS